MQSTNNKKIGAITMARNDEFFLSRWIAYYGSRLGEENLYIYLDGEDQTMPKNKGNANIIHRERIPGQVIAAEKGRLGYLSQVAANLLKTYDLIIGVDADEFLAVDPACGKSLHEYLSEISVPVSVSALGLDIGQNMNCESKLDRNQPFLKQRSYAFLSPRYTKPCVISKPVRWGSGFHRIKGHNFHIDKNLYLFHFGCVDYDMIMDRFQDKDRIATGRTRHLRKRLRAIDTITKGKTLDGNKWIPIARRIQSFLRPIYALNKPSMGGWKLVVKYPDRFKNIV